MVGCEMWVVVGQVICVRLHRKVFSLISSKSMVKGASPTYRLVHLVRQVCQTRFQLNVQLVRVIRVIDKVFHILHSNAVR